MNKKKQTKMLARLFIKKIYYNNKYNNTDQNIGINIIIVIGLDLIEIFVFI